MATIKCPDCGGQVSTSAKTCPHCGAKPPRKHSIGQWIFVGVASVLVISCIAKGQDDAQEHAAKQAAVDAAKTPQQRAAEEAAKAKRDVEFTRVLVGAKALKAGAHNPDSFVLKSAGMMDDGTICYEYSGTNAFNATVQGKFVLGAKVKSDTASAWNKYCGGKSGTDYTSVRQAL